MGRKQPIPTRKSCRPDWSAWAEIDLYHLCEVTLLAAKSLAAISSGHDYVLEISHMGLVKSLLHGIDEEVQEQIVKRISEKNIHEIHQICHAHHIDKEIDESLEILGIHLRRLQKSAVAAVKAEIG